MPSPFFFAQISWSVGLSVLTFVVLLGAAVIILLSRKREDVHATNTANVTALNNLLNTKKEEVATLEKKLKASDERAAALESELKATALEYKQLASIDLQELIHADKLRRENEAVKAENRELRRELERAGDRSRARDVTDRERDERDRDRT